jgi:hypothetical protein
MQPRTRGGIGSAAAAFMHMDYKDPHSLNNHVGEPITAVHLDTLQAVQIVFDRWSGSEGQEKIIYFMVDGSTKIISVQELLVKPTKELQYVLYLLKVKNRVTKEWSDMILSTIRKRFIDGTQLYDGNYTPLYIHLNGKEVEMKKKSAEKVTVFGKKQLNLNTDGRDLLYILLEDDSLHRSSLRVLRAALFQVDESDKDITGLTELLVRLIDHREEELLNNFLESHNMFERCSDA